MATLVSHPSSSFGGAAEVPPDKSIAHRALIIAALAPGQSRIASLPESADVQATVRCLRALGVGIEKRGAAWRINGVGTGGLRTPTHALDFGNSGTAARLLLGALASHEVVAECVGDESLSRRPMARVLEPLRKMGVRTEPEDAQTLPFTFHGSAETVPVEWRLEVPSAQVKSAILLAGLDTMGETRVIEPVPTRDHAERMLKTFGARLKTKKSDSGRVIAVAGWGELSPQTISIPGDFSSAAFLLLAAILSKRGRIKVKGVGINPGRTGFLTALRKMGVLVKISRRRMMGGEPVADLEIESAPLKAIRTAAADAPFMIDEFPALFAAAACAKGKSIFTGLSELRHKESNRLRAMAEGLRANGVEVEKLSDGLRITGCAGRVPGGGVVEACHDHRIAMAHLVLGLATEKPVAVTGAETIATSFPGFARLMNRLGADIREGA